MQALALDRKTLTGVAETVAAKVSGAGHSEAEDAVQTALLEWLEKGDDLDLDTSRPVAGALVTRAIWRLKSARARREARNLSLDAFAEADEDSAPVELAVNTEDFDSHVRLAEARADPILCERLSATEHGASPWITPRGAFCGRTKYTDEQVAEARRLRREEKLSYHKIADRIGCSEGIVERWVKRELRVVDTPGWTGERVIAALRRHFERYGESPLFEHLKDHPELPSSTSIVRLFGSFNKALEAAGLPTRYPWKGGTAKHTKETLDAAFLAFVERHGRWPLHGELRACNGFSGAGVLMRFYGTTSPNGIRALISASSPQGEPLPEEPGDESEVPAVKNFPGAGKI